MTNHRILIKIIKGVNLQYDEILYLMNGQFSIPIECLREIRYDPYLSQTSVEKYLISKVCEEVIEYIRINNPCIDNVRSAYPHIPENILTECIDFLKTEDLIFEEEGILYFTTAKELTYDIISEIRKGNFSLAELRKFKQYINDCKIPF